MAAIPVSIPTSLLKLHVNPALRKKPITEVSGQTSTMLEQDLS
jgi:hypothetical protein